MNALVAEQKARSSILSARSIDHQMAEITRIRLPRESLNLLGLFFALILLTSCGGRSGTPIQPPAPSASRGHFRLLKSVTASPMLSTTAFDDTNAPTSSMTYARSSATATLLQDGRVLVAGGSVDPTGAYTAEVFDPATETFSLLNSTMSWGRVSHCAVTLPDKRVLLIGGWGLIGVWGVPPTVDIFDPTTDTFTAQLLSGALPDNSEGPIQCFPLPGSRVFINAFQSGLMVLDTQTWWTRALQWNAGSMPSYSSVAQTPDGKVLFIGGRLGYVSTASIFRFDPQTEAFSILGQLQQDRDSAGILPFPDNSVEVYGGLSSSPLDGGGYSLAISSIERIDSAGNTNHIGDLPMPKAFQASVMLQNGKSLQVGGSDINGAVNDTQYVFDETTHIPGVTGNMTEERAQYGITPLLTGRILIVGGDSYFGIQSNTAEIFEPDASLYVLMPETTLAPGESMKLSAESSTSSAVTWTAKYGTVTSAGEYTAPLENPNGSASPVTTVQDEVTATLSVGAKATVPITVQFPTSTTP